MPARKPAAETVAETRTLLVNSRHDGTFKIEIPADWKVTFGAFQSGRFGGEGGAALRIYEAENKQRACFVDVKSFRDLSIPVSRLIKQKSGESHWEDSGDGDFSESRKVKSVTLEVPDGPDSPF